MAVIPRNYARASDKKLAATVVEQALADDLPTRPPAPPPGPRWAACGWRRRHRRRAGGGAPRPGRSTRRPKGPALLALELMDPKLPAGRSDGRALPASGKPLPEMRMGYARALLDAQRYAEAAQQLAG